LFKKNLPKLSDFVKREEERRRGRGELSACKNRTFQK
jgi:hypothetical protein